MPNSPSYAIPYHYVFLPLSNRTKLEDHELLLLNFIVDLVARRLFTVGAVIQILPMNAIPVFSVIAKKRNS